MSKRTTDIFAEFEHIRERMEQAYQRVIGAPGSPNFAVPLMEPLVDVYETDDEVVIVAEIAGIAEEEVELNVEGDTLTLRGQRKPLGGPPGRLYSQMEIPHGMFQRDILLPAAVDAEKAQAVYRQGLLEIALPKASPSHIRQLRIMVK